MSERLSTLPVGKLSTLYLYRRCTSTDHPSWLSHCQEDFRHKEPLHHGRTNHRLSSACKQFTRWGSQEREVSHDGLLKYQVFPSQNLSLKTSEPSDCSFSSSRYLREECNLHNHLFKLPLKPATNPRHTRIEVINHTGEKMTSTPLTTRQVLHFICFPSFSSARTSYVPQCSPS